MNTLEDDILEYSHMLEKLQKENLLLKQMLRRFAVFGGPDFSGNLFNADICGNLREAEELFSTMFDTLQVPAFAGELCGVEPGAQPDFVFSMVNARFAEFFHLEPAYIIGKTNSSLGLLKPELWMHHIMAVTKRRDRAEVEILDSDDRFYVSLFSHKPNVFVAHYVTASDSITRKQSREMLHNLRFTQMMVDAIPTPVFYKDMEGHYLLCNQSYANSILGVSADTIIGKTALELVEIFPKEYADFYQEKDVELIKDKGIQTYQGPIKCADGVVREFIVNKTLIKDDYGKFTGILGVMQDIDHMLKARRELAESENRYKTLFNGIGQPIIVVDSDGNIITLNTTAVDLFEEDETSLMDYSTQVIPAQKLINMDYVKHVFDTGKPISHRVSIYKDGQERWYFCTMQLISDFFGEKVVQIISNDITEIKHYQAELLAQKQQAEESNNLKTVFLANIAHETRTPANMISGLAQMIKQGINPGKHQEYIANIYHNCTKLLEIIDDIVQLSQIETGQLQIRHEICSINNIVEEAFQHLQRIVTESGKNIRISHSAPQNEYKSLVYADNQHISQVFHKLIDNAVTFTQDGEIEIGAELDENVATFYVRDTGIGIPKEKLDIIFESFRQVDEGASRQYGGNGLGLAIANELVKCMNGTICVSSAVGEGSNFRFAIPYRGAGV